MCDALRITVAIGGAIAACATSPAAVVYNSVRTVPQPIGLLSIADPDETNSATELPGTVQEREFDAQIGDLITLAGTDRFVTDFTVRLVAFSPYTSSASADVTLRIFTNSGGLPGTPLWSGTVAGVTLPLSDTGVNVSFAPNITVPNGLVFALSLANISNPAHRGLGFGANNTVYTGSSPVSLVAQDTATQVWRNVVYPSPFEHVEARVTAVPAPAALAALAMLPLIRRRMRAG